LSVVVANAAGNRFALVGAAPVHPSDTAGLCETWSLDGVLAVGPAHAGGDVSMRVFNKDGGEAQACGNGLRCAALWAVDRGLVGADRMRIETASGVRVVELLRAPDGSARGARAGMGAARVRFEQIELEGVELEVARVDLGNPHAVLFVPDPARARVERTGRLLQTHALFPGGVNVGFAAYASQPACIRLRVFERGVGETAACGSGACAAVAAASARGLAELPVTVCMRGGELRVGADESGELWLEGPVRYESSPEERGAPGTLYS
jgi:diaminopimelate epimerase